jgi:CheY-like chemotaxis protein
MKNPPRFILLDDDLFALTIATKIIRNYNRPVEIISFSVSKEAIEYMEADSFKGNYPDTVFLTDLHMPEIDGFALLDRMENTFKAVKERPYIFVLSAAACPDEISRVLSYSCVTGFYNKPLSMDKMRHIMTCVPYQF